MKLSELDQKRLMELAKKLEKQVANEVGRELKADELKPRMIVVTNPEYHPTMFLSMWVTRVSASMVWLLMAATEPAVNLGLFRQKDGTLKDDAGRTIRIFEYLGAE